jgi:Kef-type K+ transport system membrane component KefB
VAAGALLALLIALRFVLAPLVEALLRRYPIEEGRVPASLMAIALCLMFGLGVVTYQIGIFAIFGGFAAGLLFHRHAAFVEAWHTQVGRFVLVFFLPIFFIFTGLRTNLLGLGPSDPGWLVLVLAAGMAGKVVPVFVAGRDSNRSSILGALMNTRGLMELIALNIGYDLGFVPQFDVHHARSDGGGDDLDDRAAAAPAPAARRPCSLAAGPGLIPKPAGIR